MSTSTLRRADPMEADRLRRKAGSAVRELAPKQSTIARVLDINPSDVSRICRGQRSNEFARLFEHIYVGARNGLAVESIIVEAMVEAERGRMGRTTESLVREWWSLTRQEHADQANEDGAHDGFPVDPDAAVEADLREAKTQMRRAAIRKELNARLEQGEAEADPYHAKWRAT